MIESEMQPQTADTSSTPADVDPKIAAFVKGWTKKIKAARKHHEGAFKQMRKCMQIARDGADKAWIKSEKYVVPIINRHINVAVGQLYAKAPTAVAKRKHRLMGTVWNGKMGSLQEAVAQLKMTTPGMQPDPTVMAVIQDAEQVKAYIEMMDGLAETLGILFEHFISEKAAMYKQHFKALVRRVKVTAVGYVKLGFHRMLEADPDVVTRIHETTERISNIQQMMEQNAREPFDEESAELEQLQSALRDLQQQEQLIVNEGPLLAFPGSTRIIIDPACIHLKTLAGADWWAEEFDMLPERIEQVYGVDVKEKYERYKDDTDERRVARWSDKDGDVSKQEMGKVWFVQNRKTGQEFTICDGYPGYLKPPQQPEVQLKRFFTLFPLVFNECEDEDEIFPPSDVWQARDTQYEYNRIRQGLREHRKANRPAYVSSKGTFEEDDLKKFQEHEVAEIIETNVQLTADQKIEDVLQAKPTMQIDQKMYETQSLFDDLLRVVGSQQADLGPTSGETATESSIAEQSRSISLADNVDELDDFLGLIADGMSELMLREMSREIVVEIAGPGAVWPSLPQTREEIIEDIVLSIRGGSSGRPNQAAELAKMDRAMPHLLQLPNVNPTPIVEKYTDLLDLGVEDLVVEGLPSINAINAMMSKPAQQPATGNPKTNPADQGPQGGQNAPVPSQGLPAPQPEHPAPHANPMVPHNGAPS